MSLPALVDSPGASYRGAWRAQDAVVNVSTFDQVIYVPPYQGYGGNLQTRLWNGSVWSESPTNNSVIDPTGLDGGPAVWSGGAAGQYTTDSNVLAICDGTTGKFWTAFIRARWNFGETNSGLFGFEAWVANENSYIESGGSQLIMLDRGTARTDFGATAFDTDSHTLIQSASTSADVNGYIDSAGTPDATLAYDTPFTADAYMIGPVQRTASSTHPPGVFQYSNELRWSRHVLVEGAVGPTDWANLILWVEGEDFPEVSTANGLFFGMAP